jgi:hypothetical protein
MKVKDFFAVDGDDGKGGWWAWLWLVEAQGKRTPGLEQNQRRGVQKRRPPENTMAERVANAFPPNSCHVKKRKKGPLNVSYGCAARTVSVSAASRQGSGRHVKGEF